MDFCVVVLGFVDIFTSGNLTALRTVRVLRPLRAVTRIRGMRVRARGRATPGRARLSQWRGSPHDLGVEPCAVASGATAVQQSRMAEWHRVLTAAPQQLARRSLVCPGGAGGPSYLHMEHGLR